MKNEVRSWLVVGVWDDNLRSWSHRAEASSPLAAAGIAMKGLAKKRSALLVGVFRLGAQLHLVSNESPFRHATPYDTVLRTLEDQHADTAQRH